MSTDDVFLAFYIGLDILLFISIFFSMRAVRKTRIKKYGRVLRAESREECMDAFRDVIRDLNERAAKMSLNYKGEETLAMPDTDQDCQEFFHDQIIPRMEEKRRVTRAMSLSVLFPMGFVIIGLLLFITGKISLTYFLIMGGCAVFFAFLVYIMFKMAKDLDTEEMAAMKVLDRRIADVLKGNTSLAEHRKYTLEDLFCLQTETDA